MKAARWVLLALVLSGSALADPRVRVVTVGTPPIVPIEVALGQHLHVELPPGERFLNLAAGDTGAIDAGADGRHLMLKPTRLAGPMTLSVLTTAGVHQFEYRAVAVARAPVQVLRLVAPTSPAVSAGAVDVNLDYLYCGDPSLRPVRASDDGLHVRLTFGPSAELPAVYARAADGTEALVNTHVEGTTVVVQRLAERLVLRRGRLVGCVFNRAYAERGRLPPAQSAVPGLGRVDVGGAP